MLPDWDRLQRFNETGRDLSPVIIAEVRALPRKANIEWWTTGLAGIPDYPPECRARFHRVEYDWGHTTIMACFSRLQEVGHRTKQHEIVAFMAVLMRSHDEGHSDLDLDAIVGFAAQSIRLDSEDVWTDRTVHELSGTALLSLDKGWSICNHMNPSPLDSQLSVIPCQKIWAQVPNMDCDAPLEEVGGALLLRVELTMSVQRPITPTELRA